MDKDFQRYIIRFDEQTFELDRQEMFSEKLRNYQSEFKKIPQSTDKSVLSNTSVSCEMVQRTISIMMKVSRKLLHPKIEGVKQMYSEIHNYEFKIDICGKADTIRCQS